MFSAVKIIFDNFKTCMKYVKRGVNADTSEEYYYFDKSIIDNNTDEIQYIREIYANAFDCVVISTDSFDQEQLWIAMNDSHIGMTVFPKARSGYNSFVISGNSIEFRFSDKDNEEYDIPTSTDQYFNLNLVYQLPFSMEEFIEIDTFLRTNKKIMNNYSIMLEVS